MNLPQSSKRRQPRGAFTLVELLVVISIILVLMSLLVAGVMKAGALGKRTSNTNDIQQLNAAVVNVMQQYNLTYIPSRIFIDEDLTQYANPTSNYAKSVPAQLRIDSQTFLARMFPKLNFTGTNPSAPTKIDWNGDGTAGDQEVILEGDQCLVFFVGGIPTSTGGVPGVTGFSTNPTDPAWHVANPGAAVRGPFYEFRGDRLYEPRGQGTQFWSYKDAYGVMPYIYFSNYGKRNQYWYGYANYGGNSDVNSLPSITIFPYAEAFQSSSPSYPLLRFQKPDGFQIISAGADKQLGPGSYLDPSSNVLLWNANNGFYWQPASASATAPPGVPDAGNDDQTNFTGLLLGDAGS